MKLRFKNRNGVLYFGVGGRLQSAKKHLKKYSKYTEINKNILKGKYKNGDLDVILGFEPEVKIPLLTEILENVLLEKSKVLKHNTILAYKSLYGNNMKDFFADFRINDIKPILIRDFYLEMIDRGLKRQTIGSMKVLLKDAFNIAYLSEFITSNHAKNVDIPRMKPERKKIVPFTLDEIDLILEHSSEEMRNFLGISFFTGMRSGELLALKWEDIDFENETISITKTIATGIINSTKTVASERVIEMLEKAKEYFKRQQYITGLKGEYIFLNNKGSFYTKNTSVNRRLKETLEKLYLPMRTLHNTRHTFASLMLNNGIDVMWVSNILGHENVQITLKIYSHFMKRDTKMKLPFLDKRYKTGT
jgi:integrase